MVSLLEKNNFEKMRENKYLSRNLSVFYKSVSMRWQISLVSIPYAGEYHNALSHVLAKIIRLYHIRKNLQVLKTY
jgi:hypothetical protein